MVSTKARVHRVDEHRIHASQEKLQRLAKRTWQFLARAHVEAALHLLPQRLGLLITLQRLHLHDDIDDAPQRVTSSWSICCLINSRSIASLTVMIMDDCPKSASPSRTPRAQAAAPHAQSMAAAASYHPQGSLKMHAQTLGGCVGTLDYPPCTRHPHPAETSDPSKPDAQAPHSSSCKATSHATSQIGKQ